MARRARSQFDKSFELLLTPLLDIFVIILVFLLKTYDTSIATFSLPGSIQLPVSESEKMIGEAVNVFISPEGLIIDKSQVMSFNQFIDEEGEVLGEPISDDDLSDGGRLILPLFDELKLRRDAMEAINVEDTEDDEYQAIINLVSDKQIPYALLKKIMYTSTAAGYQTFKLAVRKQQNL
jgi:biopolymer transport protein ExbD